ncbi:MAG: UDP-3-O-(3-hydroxymyristoyl)glucosamine N-acyltransferase [Luminiphilus sp.]|nr:UDP-3-O-(3-hydroxymyristoyl)glucosamine N-acyltransferase [Luminiphilus sp.]
MLKLGDIAERLDLVVRGDAEVEVLGVAPLATAEADQLSFVVKKNHLAMVSKTRAGALILREEWVEHWPGTALLSDDPYLSFAKISQLFDDRPEGPETVHPSAIVHPSVDLASGVSIGPHAVLEEGVVIGKGVTIGAGVYVGHHSRIGSRTRVYPNVVIYHGVIIGEDCIIHGNATLGADGFGFAPSREEGWVKIIQRGGVQLGNRVEIGAGTTIDRGALEDTVLEDNVIIDDQVHIGHNVTVGARTGIAACTGIGGSTVIGRDCTLAGMVGVGDHIHLADNVHVNGQGRVSKSLEEPGLYASGTPIQPYRDWSKNAVRFEQLATLARRVASLEKQLAEANPDGEMDS